MAMPKEKLAALNVAFSPSAPISKKDFFQGRLNQLEAVIDSINERGQHVIVYGERGVGKTSFTNIIVNDLSNVFPVKVTCNRTDSYGELWDKAFRKVKFEKSVSTIGFHPSEKTTNQQLDFFTIEQFESGTLDVQFVLEKVNRNLLFVFDEFDSVVDSNTITRMADTIKALSDNAPNVTCMLVGIGDNVTDLIGEHPSIERCMKQIYLPRMSGSEIEGIATKGFGYLKLSFEKEVCNSIVHFSMGFPHFAQLLGKAYARAAIEVESDTVMLDYLPGVLGSAVQRVDESVRSSYEKATISSKDGSLFEKVLWACTASETDQHATFRAKDVLTEFLKVFEKRIGMQVLTYHLTKLCSAERDSVLEKVGSANQPRYRFRTPLMRAFARLKFQSAEHRALVT